MTGIFFGSTTGTTEAVARDLAIRLGVADGDVYDVAVAPADAFDRYDLLLLGSSTWGCGDLQDDWYVFLDAVKGKNLCGKKVALFGCGDSAGYPDTFCDAVGLIHDGLQQTGCVFVGAYEPLDYGKVVSSIYRDGKLLGLAIDESDTGKSDGRIAAWCELLISEMP